MEQTRTLIRFGGVGTGIGVGRSQDTCRCGGRGGLMTAMEFEIRVSGGVPPSVLEELGGIRMVNQSLETVLQGPVLDQAALVGIINRLQSLGIELRGFRQLHTAAGPSPGPAPAG